MIRCRHALLIIPTLALFALCQGCGRPEPQASDANLALLREGKFEEAAKRLKQAAAETPGDAAAHCNLGLAYWKLGKTKEAILALKEADRLSDRDERPLEFLGQIHVAEGQLADARRMFGLALERAPDSARIVTSQAVVEYYAGEFGRAGKLLKRAAVLDPNYAPALFNLGVMYRGRIGGKAKAVQYFSRYAAMAPDGPRRKTAQDFVTRAAQDDPPSPPQPAGQPGRKDTTQTGPRPETGARDTQTGPRP